MIVIVLDAKVADTPAGKPVVALIPVAPVVVCVIAVNAVLIHREGVEEAAPAVLAGVTVIVIVAVFTVPQVPLVTAQKYPVVTVMLPGV